MRALNKREVAPPQWPVRLAAAASVDRPMQAGGPWILSLGGVPKARISADVAAVLQALDGEKSPVQVAEQLGRPWTAEDVDAVVGSVARTGIFDDGAHPAEVRWIQFRAPLTIQVTLFNPMAFLLALRPLAAVMARRESLVLALTLLLGGVIGLTTAVPEVMRVLSTPLALEAYLGVAAAMFGSTLLHELGHGLALTHFGGRPRRIGIMLFYLSPAFFCDVTDGWRLPSRMQRVVVALAGPLVHLGLGSVALCAQAFIAASTFKDGVLLYGVLCYIVAVLNLFPFIKLDGYVALMSALDTPHLRRKSMDAAAEWVGRYLLGTKVVLQRRGALRWFGVASFVSGLGFMALGFQRLIPLFLQLGMAGHVLVALACVLLVVLSARSAILFFRAAARKGSSFARRLLMGILAGGGVAALLAVVPVAPTMTVGYQILDGRLGIVVPADSPGPAPTVGARVSLQTQGLLFHQELGLATIGSLPPSESKAPMETVVPVTFPGIKLPVISYDAGLVEGGQLPAYGRAEVSSTERVGLGEWLWRSVANSPLWPGGHSDTRPSTGRNQS